jgi:hypothetical protein
MAVGAAALLFVAFLLLLLTPPPASPQADLQGGNAAVAFSIRSAEIADYGGKPAAVLYLYETPLGNYSVSAACSALPMQGSAALLAHAAVPGTAKNLADEVAGALAKNGFSSTRAGLPEALAMRNSVIIAPTGAIPSALAMNASTLAGANSRLIVLQSLPGRAIEEDGDIVEANESETAFAALVRLRPGREGEAAAEAAREALFGRQAWGQYALREGNGTIAIPLEGNLSETHCRAIMGLGGGKYRFSDSGRVDAYPGRLEGPPSVIAGKEAEFELSGISEQERGRNLRFAAVSSAGRREVARKEIAGGTITEGWATGFSLNFSGGGPHVVRVVDQYGRVHAAAYIDVEGLEASLGSKEGNRYEVFLRMGGKPAEGKVLARIDDGQAKEFQAENGTVVIFAAPAQGSHVMGFDLGGARAEMPFSHEGGGFVESYAKYAAAGAILLLAFYLAVGAARKAKYRIVFPDSAPRQEIARLSWGDMRDAWRASDGKNGGHCLPAYPHEIAESIAIAPRKKGERIHADAQSCLFALRRLSKQGVFAECGGGFMPATELSGFSPGQMGVLRLVHDIMLEHGLLFRKGRLIRAEGGEYEISLFCGKRALLERMGKKPRAVLFAGEEELEGLKQELAEPTPQNNRVKIAVDNGWLIFLVAKRSTVEPLLP